MSDLQNNSSTTPLLAGGVFTGTLIRITDPKLSTVSISINTDASGTVECFFSQDSYSFANYGDSFPVGVGYFHKEVICKNQFFYLKYTNGSDAQTVFNLFTKLTLNNRDQNVSGGGGTGGDVNITGCEVTLPVSLITGFATETTLGAINTLLDDNISTGGVNVSLTALDGEKITNTVVFTKRGLDCNIINLPATQEVSGTVAISNTSFEISNLPATQEVSGTVAISNTSFEISNLPATQEVSGTVAFSNTAIEISNLPATQEVSGTVAFSNTAIEISNLPATQEVSGTVAFSNTAIEISNLPTTQAVSIADAVSVDINNVNSTVYDFTNDSSTITQADNRFEVDRIRPDSWSFSTIKSQGGSNCFFFSNSSGSPLNVQQYNIQYSDLESLYFVAGINKTNINSCPFMAIYSPSNTGFFTSRWIFTIKSGQKITQGQKILLYFGVDPVNFHTNLPHVELELNVIASQGSRLPEEIIYLMSINSASGLASGDIYFHLYNAGFILNDVKKTHNDYAFDSGINSKKDLVLSKLNIAGDSSSLAVAVSNVVSCGIANASFTTIGSNSCLNVNVGNIDVPVSNTALTFMSFKEVASATYGLEVVNKNVQQSTNYLFTESDLTITDETPSINVTTFRLMSIFGSSSHSGPGSHNIILEYSTNNNTWFDSPNVISTNSSGKFALDLKDFCVSYIRFRFQVEITDLNMNVCLK